MGRKPWLYSIDDKVIVKYVNQYNGTGIFHDLNGYLKAPISGPEYVKHLFTNPSVKSFLRRFKQLKSITPATESVAIDVDCNTTSLLHSLLRSDPAKKDTMSNHAKTKIMSNKGSLLVIIEGPIHCLTSYSNLQWHYCTINGDQASKKPFLIPFANDALQGKNVYKSRQRFHVKKDANPLNNIPGCSEHISDFDDVCETDKDFPGPITTTCYDMSCLNNGLILAFRMNENLDTPIIKQEITLDDDMQPNQVYKTFDGAIVLSEWFKHDAFYGIKEEGIRLVHKVHGQRGFGSRSRSSCVGTNVYHGERQTGRTVGNPL